VQKARFSETNAFGTSAHRGEPLLAQHVGFRLTKLLPSTFTPC
jgi:hypothetical protein